SASVLEGGWPWRSDPAPQQRWTDGDAPNPRTTPQPSRTTPQPSRARAGDRGSSMTAMDGCPGSGRTTCSCCSSWTTQRTSPPPSLMALLPPTLPPSRGRGELLTPRAHLISSHQIQIALDVFIVLDTTWFASV
uniref:Uncharacterized protein n=1 Tax=Aegilops tauschii subsp. strangulata TaxID=200361 RepID=A0A453SQ35_AEGTS